MIGIFLRFFFNKLASGFSCDSIFARISLLFGLKTKYTALSMVLACAKTK